MKKILSSWVLFMIILACFSCQGSKEVAYFQNIDSVSLEGSRYLYDARIVPKDMLTITVMTTDQDAAAPFNLAIGSQIGNNGQMSNNSNLQGYLVDNDGNINFPIVGKLHVVGLTKGQCEDLIVEKIAPYLAAGQKPIVTVRMSSFRVVLIGAVGGARVVPVTTEKMSIIEAIASAGDLNIYGKRTNIMLIRERPDGQKEVHRLNLNDANIFNSPYYYLQQNDIIYVEPNNVAKHGAELGAGTSMWFSLVGIVTSVASLLVNILRN